MIEKDYDYGRGDLTYTHVYERARKKIGISRDEYALANYVDTWKGYPGNSRPGWCDRTLGQKAEFIGITTRGITKMQNRLIEMGIIEKDPSTSHTRTTKAWFHLIHEARADEGNKPIRLDDRKGREQSSQDEQGTKFPEVGNEVPTNEEQSSQEAGNKVPTHNKKGVVNSNKGYLDTVELAEIEPPVKTVIEFLNRLTGASYRFDTKATIQSVAGRLKENYSVDDLLLVVEHKTTTWLNDEKMKEYLRPITLFGKEKFEGYLQAAKIWIKNGKTIPSNNGKYTSSNNEKFGAGVNGSTSGAFN